MNLSTKLRGQQQGFIQGAILVGLALLVVVVAGFSLANRDAASSTSKEKARMDASVILKQAVDLKDAVFRGFADANGNNFSTYATLRTSGYITEIPTAPTDSAAGVTPVWGGTNGNLGVASLTGFGSTGGDWYIHATPISDEVCRRINAALYGSSTIPLVSEINFNVTTNALTMSTNPWLSRTEGCVLNSASTANGNVYYKIVVIR